MSATSPPQTDGPARWIDTLPGVADPTRLRLLRLLERHELGVAELCDVVQMPQSTVSRHLKLLADEGWVSSRRHGTTNLYRMILDELDQTARALWVLAREQTESWATLQQDHVRLAERLRQRNDPRSFFDGAAEQWAHTRDELYGSTFRRLAIAALLPGNWTVADLGCGTGDITAELARHVGQVIGVDNTPAMLDAARVRTADLDNVTLHEADLESLPTKDGTCDAAVMMLVLTYLPDPEAAVREMCRVCKPGGKAVIVDLMRHDREDFRRDLGQQSMGFDPDALSNLLAACGFAQTTCDPIPPDPQCKGPALLLATGLRS